MKVIGFMGLMGSGKSVASNHLVKNYQYVEYAFATPLKRALQEIFMFSDEQLYGTQEQKQALDSRWFNCSSRTTMQFVGTDLLRDNLDKIMPGLGKDIFTHRFRLWYDNELKKNPNVSVVISDVRFQNEVDCINAMGGYVVKINRPMLVKNDHVSETEQEAVSYDYLIDNDSTLDDFYRLIDDIIKK